MKKITLITGGGRSGKSNYAVTLARSYQKRIFVATAEAFDREMEERIARHKADRGKEFITIEEPVEIVKEMRKVVSRADVILLDCLTVWLGNLMHRFPGRGTVDEKTAELTAFLDETTCSVIVVTNEVGLGIVPENPMAREFRDVAGRLNQQIAAVADHVTLLVCGIPISVK